MAIRTGPGGGRWGGEAEKKVSLERKWGKLIPYKEVERIVE